MPGQLTGVVVVNFASAHLLERHVAGLGLDRQRCRVVVVDNFSGTAERTAIAELSARHDWTLVPLEGNEGFGGGANAGARAAVGLGCDTLLFLNPDAVVTAAALYRLAAGVAADRHALVTPVLLSPLRDTVDRGSVLDLRSGRIRRAGRIPDEHAQAWVPATCLAVDAALFDRIGGFDESYFLYWEDVDLSVRAAAAGGRLVVDESVQVVHDSGGTQRSPGGRAKSALYYRYNCRNRLLFAARHLPRRDLVRWLLRTPAEARQILLQGGRRQLLRPLAPLTAIVRGCVAGVLVALAALVRPGSRHGRRAGAPDSPGRVPGTSPQPTDRPLRRLTVAVATYRRPDQLAALLPELVAQVGLVMGTLGGDDDGELDAEVLVVDNDAGGSGAEVVRALDLPGVRAVVEATPGISAARNRALDECVGRDLLAFIDDDETPGPGWLAALVETWRATGATGVIGPVESSFAVPPEQWVVAGEFFAHRSRRDTRTGQDIPRGATNNLLLDLHQLAGLGLRFDQQFGLSGGGDTRFTTGILRRGGRLVWCREAVVRELVPADRLTRRHLLGRALSYGTTDIRVLLAEADGPAARAGARATSCASGLARIGWGAARWGYGASTGSDRHDALGLQTLMRGVGLVAGSFGYSYDRYRRGSETAPVTEPAVRGAPTGGPDRAGAVSGDV